MQEDITDDTQKQVSDELADLTNKSSDAMSAEDISTASDIMTNLTKSVTTVDDRVGLLFWLPFLKLKKLIM